MRGTSGLVELTSSPSAIPSRLEGPIILEVTHLTEVGASVFDVEDVRLARRCLQWEERKAVARSLAVNEAGRSAQPSVPLPQYPRDRLKLYLSDGFLELEALESPEHRLLGVALGRTPMGTKVRLS